MPKKKMIDVPGYRGPDRRIGKDRRRKRLLHFKDSSIVPQKFKPDLPKAERGMHLTKSGGRYSDMRDKLKSTLTRKIYLGKGNKKKLSTIMAFCKNYYIKHQELPKIEDLRRLFKF